MSQGIKPWKCGAQDKVPQTSVLLHDVRKGIQSSASSVKQHTTMTPIWTCEYAITILKSTILAYKLTLCLPVVTNCHYRCILVVYVIKIYFSFTNLLKFILSYGVVCTIFYWVNDGNQRYRKSLVKLHNLHDFHRSEVWHIKLFL